jgi:tetratricopeptide (TPR) repeat protein
MAHVWLQQYDLAEQDFAHAAAINPANYVVDHGRGMIAFDKNDLAGAITAFDKALDDRPDDDFARSYRAMALSQSGDDRKALADAERLIARGNTSAAIYGVIARSYHNLGDDDQAIAIAAKAIAGNRHDSALYLLQANNFRRKGDRVHSLAQADALIAANPGDAQSWVVAAAIYNANGEKAKGMAALDKSVAIKPTVSAYITRFNIRPKFDLAGREADAAAALKLDPGDSNAIEAQAEVDMDAGNPAVAVALLTRELKATPMDVNVLISRGIAYARSGDDTRAERDYAAAREIAGNPVALNDTCWRKAIAGVSLVSALADCDAALKLEPKEAAFRDSRAFVLLRLGRFAEAIAQYDAALAVRPDQAESLYGRAVAEARSGDTAAADRDLAAARKADSLVAERFEGYGVALATNPAKTASADPASRPAAH